MLESSGSIGTELGPSGLSILDNSRRIRWFRIISGSNPYAAQEIYLPEDTGTTADYDAGYTIAATEDVLYALDGSTTWAAADIVVGFPNPHGLGFVGILANGGTGGSALQTVNEDGTFSVSPTTVFEADEDTGVRFDGSGTAGKNRLLAIIASTTQQGVVSAPSGTLTSNELQSLGRGNKQIYDGAVYVNGTASGTPWALSELGQAEYAVAVGNATPGNFSIHTASVGYVPNSFVGGGITPTGNRAIVRAADPNGSSVSSPFLFSTELQVVANNQSFPSGTVGEVNNWYVLPRTGGGITLQPTYAAKDFAGRTCFGGTADINGLKFRKGLYIEPVFSPPPPPPITVPVPPTVPPAVIEVPVGKLPPPLAFPPSAPPTVADTLNSLVTLEQFRAVLPAFGSAARGVVPLSGGGTTNFLRADGTWTVPTGGTPGIYSTVSVVGTVSYTTAADCNKVILVSNGGIANTINIPAAATAGAGAWFIVTDIAGNAASANITIDGNASETINGATTYVISSNYGSVHIVCNGTSWTVI